MRIWVAHLLILFGISVTALLACVTTPPAITSTQTAPPARQLHPNASPMPTTVTPPKPDSRFVGVVVCSTCHQAEYQIWSNSNHSTARNSLKESRRAYSPECLSCHTTGLYRESGFSPATPEPTLENVGCESCHGPGSGHLYDPYGEIYGDLNLSEDACMSCHNEDRSPDFELEHYWLAIAH